MPLVTNYREIAKPKYIRVTLSQYGNGNEVELGEIRGKIETLEGMLNILRGDKLKEVTDKIKTLKERQETLAQEDAETYTYMVRGVTPREQTTQRLLLGGLMLPRPPERTREAMPLDQNGQVIPAGIKDEKIYDYNDPTYQKELAEFNAATSDKQTLILAHTLMCCVKGFDLTDEELKVALSEKGRKNENPFPKSPIENLAKRLEQLAFIILDDMELRHCNALLERINQLSGVTSEGVNFI